MSNNFTFRNEDYKDIFTKQCLIIKFLDSRLIQLIVIIYKLYLIKFSIPFNKLFNTDMDRCFWLKINPFLQQFSIS